MPNMVSYLKDNAFYILFFVLSAYLTLQGLDNHLFWDDEANTALPARSIVRFGNLTGFDGRNLNAYGNGYELNDDLMYSLVPPLQYYVMAASFILLGESTYTARLPFAIFGLLALLLFYFVMIEMGLGRRLRLIAFALLALCPSFLLYIRNARYFSICIFFCLAVFLFYLRYVRTSSTQDLALMTLSSILLSYSHYLSAAIFLAALGVYHLLFDYNRKRLGGFLIYSFLLLSTTVPYLLWTHFLSRASSASYYSISDFITAKLGVFFDTLIYLIDASWISWFLLLLMLYFVLYEKIPASAELQAAKRISVLIILMVFIYCLTSPTRYPWGRYLIVMIPFCCLLMAISLSLLSLKQKSVFSVFFLLVIFSNILSFIFVSPLRADLFGHIYEIHNDYETSYEAAVDFIHREVGQDQCVVVYPQYMTYPLMYYTGNKVIYCAQLNEDSILPREKVEILNPALYKENASPDWIIFFGRTRADERLDYFLKRSMTYELYSTIDIYWCDSSRPEIIKGGLFACQLHTFKPREDFDRSFDSIFVYKKN